MALYRLGRALRGTFSVEMPLPGASWNIKRCCSRFHYLKSVLGSSSSGVSYSTAAQANEDDKVDRSDETPPPGSTAETMELKKEWTPQSRRTGVIAVKLGMTQLWNKEGFPLAVTVLQVRMVVLYLTADCQCT